MGLDTTHDCFHGAYSSFHWWRCEVAKAAGIPLPLMEGFYCPTDRDPFSLIEWLLQTIVNEKATHPGAREQLAALRRFLPIRWEMLRFDPLHELLYHSDCDGELGLEVLEPLADRLEELLPSIPDEDGGGHIASVGGYRAVTERFIRGLRAAAEAGEPVEFH